jgi:hypothetical protein
MPEESSTGFLAAVWRQLVAAWRWVAAAWREPEAPAGTQGDDITRLLGDAKLMAAYAARVGRLQDSTVIETIERCEQALEGGAAPSSVTANLIEVINLLAKCIAPVTLLDLGSKWRPFPRRMLDVVIRPLFATAAVGLIIVVGDLTLIYTHAQNVSAALVDIQTQDFPSKSEHLYQHWLMEKKAIGAATSDTLPESADFFKEYNDLRNLQASLDDNTSVVKTLDAQSRMVPVAIFVRRSVRSILKQPVESGEDKGPEGEIGPDLTDDAYRRALSKQVGYGQADSVAAASAPAGAPIEGGGAALKSWIDYYNRMVVDLSQLGITVTPPQDSLSINYQISQKIRACNDIISFYGGWVLPAFYGLLGAMVFHLRGVMNPLVPTPHLGSVAVRMSLAMMAGVSISWLLASPFAKPLGVHGPALGVFGLAFMFGFSIDIFFSALDRVVVSITRSISARPA